MLEKGTKIRLKNEIIIKQNIPKEIQEGVVYEDEPIIKGIKHKNGAFIEHLDGRICG